MLANLPPFKLEVDIRTGLVFPDSEELVSLGRFVVDSQTTEETTGNHPTLELFDRASRVKEMDSRALTTDTTFGGEGCKTLIRRCIEGAAPGYPNDPLWTVEFAEGLVDTTLPGGFNADNKNRWALAKECAELMGAEIYFDIDGQPRVIPRLEIGSEILATDSVWDVAYAENLVDYKLKISRENTYNGVIVTGGPGGGDEKTPRPYAKLIDNNPQSPTYWWGKFGRKTLVISDEKITTNDQAAAKARLKLKQSMALTRTINVSCVANPALEVGDIVTVTRQNGNVDVAMVEGFSFDFTYSAFELQLRTAADIDDDQ